MVRGLNRYCHVKLPIGTRLRYPVGTSAKRILEDMEAFRPFSQIDSKPVLCDIYWQYDAVGSHSERSPVWSAA